MTLNEYTEMVAKKGDKAVLQDKTWVALPNVESCNFYKNFLPYGPTPATLDNNLAEARNWHLPIIPFVDAVNTHHRWDYKNQGPFEDFGNVNYGATGRAAGIPRMILQAGAGLAQYKDGTQKSEYGSFFSSSFGDDPKDQEQIKLGMDYFDACYEK